MKRDELGWDIDAFPLKSFVREPETLPYFGTTSFSLSRKALWARNNMDSIGVIKIYLSSTGGSSGQKTSHFQPNPDIVVERRLN
jgi:hypothetical protein